MAILVTQVSQDIQDLVYQVTQVRVSVDFLGSQAPLGIPVLAGFQGLADYLVIAVFLDLAVGLVFQVFQDLADQVYLDSVAQE